MSVIQVKVLEAFKSGKKYAIIDCGTGVGKSAIGLTIAKTINGSSEYDGNFLSGSYFLTTQKILQDQYEKDFSKNGLTSLYSSSNYSCKVDKSLCCKEVLTALRTSSLPKKFGSCGYNCTYKEKRTALIDGSLGITNFSFFLTEKNYSKKFPHKRVLVIDEAHNLENELSRFIEISISDGPATLQGAPPAHAHKCGRGARMRWRSLAAPRYMWPSTFETATTMLVLKSMITEEECAQERAPVL